MDKGAVLSGVLKPKGTSTLLGGEPPVSVINSRRYIHQTSPATQHADKNENNESSSLDHAIHTALSGEARNVVLVGEEGSGKTTTLEKLVVDWAKEEHLQHFSYVFYFHLKDIHSLKDPLSLENLIMQHYQGHIPLGSMHLFLQKPEDVLFVFDDLDRCNLTLDPSAHALCSDPSQAVSVSCLMSSLLHGSLLKGAAFVVTTRPAEHLKFLSGTRMEVCGFLKPQREAYFNVFFPDPSVAQKALEHMERTLGFYNFCSSPRFCWTVCSVYKILVDAGAKFPETLSELFVDILVQLMKVVSLSEACNRELVLALGRMASHCYLDQHSRCTKEELDCFGFQPFLSSVDTFLQVDGDLHSDTCVFSFTSQLMLEFILAVSLFLGKSPTEGVAKVLEKHRVRAEFLDLFLSGLSEPIQRKPLETLLGALDSGHIMDFKRWFKSSSDETLKGWHKDQHYRCFHLLHQAQNKTLVKEVITLSARIGNSYGDLSLRDCVALNFVIMCLGEMKVLNLYRMKDMTEEKAQVLAPAMSASHEIHLSDSTLSSGAVVHLASALSKGITKELDLSNSHLGDVKLKILCDGLRDCKLLNIKLRACELTAVSCEDLVSALTSGYSELRVLEIMFNHIGDQGLMTLCTALHSPQCKLQELQLQGTDLTSTSMETLSAALCSENSALRKVNLTQNRIGDSGMEALCNALQHPLCKLQSLNLFSNELTDKCCPRLTETLMSEHCSVSELDLSVNDVGQEGALLLCQALSHPGCPLEKLGLTRCQLTLPVFKELGSLLRSGTSRIKSLFVGLNKVGDQGVQHILDAVADPNCLLEELDLEMTNLTDACVDHLCAAIRASKTLKNLELRNNSLTDASVPALVRVMQESDNMQEMNLKYNDFSEEVFDMLDECDRIRY